MRTGPDFRIRTVRLHNGEPQPALCMSMGEQSLIWLLPSFPLSGGYTVLGEATPPVASEPGAGLRETVFEIPFLNADARLEICIRWRPGRNVLRLRYRLLGNDCFDGLDGRQSIIYGRLLCGTESGNGRSSRDEGDCAKRTREKTREEASEKIRSAWRVTRIGLSSFDRIYHTYMPSFVSDTWEALEGMPLPEPILLAEDVKAGGAVLAAYEHGAMTPDHFLEWELKEDRITLRSSKGNYYGGQPVGEYAAPWIEIGFGSSREELMRSYRRFVMEDMALWGDSRKPYIFYNTWHMQEANTYFHGDSYLKYLKEDVILRDIEIAHRIGVEVYVIDAGWFSKTGDWQVNDRFFPRNMKAIRDKLELCGMRLGLWINPIAAAKTSGMYVNHPEWVMSLDGEETYWGRIWDTEESYGMCLSSGYSDALIEELVRLHRELGVSYFKWDGVWQYGCDCPRHRHGTDRNAPRERRDSYAYRMGLEMIRVAQEISRRCPGCIVDFDITEEDRFVGLGFLAAGKYFLMNNGPYFSSFDIPDTVRIQPDFINVFFFPGAARGQVCRQGTRYDSLIPSNLFLTHFFPHGDERAGRNAMASLALGGSGIWGFLGKMSEDMIDRWADFIRMYKLVREDAEKAYPVRSGRQGASPEIHEKINPENGRGLVAFFTHAAGSYFYVTQYAGGLPDRTVVAGADSVEILPGGRIRLEVKLEKDEARVVWFNALMY